MGKREILVRKKIRVRNNQGLHVRPAALFVRLANKFNSDIILKRGRQRVNGKSITEVLILGCENGSEVELIAKGNDAVRAIRELSQLLSKEEPAP